MGNEIGFIKIANLEGTTKALATAADLDQDGKVKPVNLLYSTDWLEKPV